MPEAYLQANDTICYNYCMTRIKIQDRERLNAGSCKNSICYPYIDPKSSC